MDFLFYVNMLALLFSFFVAGVLLGVFFHHTRTGRKVIAHARQKLRVLMFGWEFPPFNSGGLGVACLGLIRALSDKNLDIVFVMPKRLPSSFPFAKMVSAELEHATVRVINSPVTPYVSSETYACYKDGVPVYGADLVSEARRYAQFGASIATEEPHDLIYAHDWLSFGAGIEARKISKKPLVVHVHSTEFDRAGGENIDQRIYDLERSSMHAADRIVAVSHWTKHTITDRYDVPDDKVHVVWNGIDETTAPSPDSSIPARVAALKLAGYKIVLFMGRITIQKGPDYFVRATRRVIDRNPNVLFILAGSGNMERQMMHMAASLGIADKMFFPGFLRDHKQHEAYALADLFVMSSVSEPFGLTVLEAMRAGTPVIVSKQSGVAEAITSVLKVDFWDIERMADLMLSVLESPTLHAELREKGIIEAASLTWDRAAGEIRAIIDGLAIPKPTHI